MNCNYNCTDTQIKINLSLALEMWSASIRHNDACRDRTTYYVFERIEAEKLNKALESSQLMEVRGVAMEVRGVAMGGNVCYVVRSLHASLCLIDALHISSASDKLILICVSVQL